MFSSQILNKKNPRKITFEERKALIELVFKNQFSIKQAASQLQINYSSAKGIIRKYRDTKIRKRPTQKNNAKTCNYKTNIQNHQNIKVISTQGGFERY